MCLTWSSSSWDEGNKYSLIFGKSIGDAITRGPQNQQHGDLCSTSSVFSKKGMGQMTPIENVKEQAINGDKNLLSRRVELLTSSMLGWRSNQLSYESRYGWILVHMMNKYHSYRFIREGYCQTGLQAVSTWWNPSDCRFSYFFHFDRNYQA